MNRWQRMKNRATAKQLIDTVREIQLGQHICENCGHPGGHWRVIRGISLEAILEGRDDSEGFWDCEHGEGEAP
jgi:hypothetical protein